MLQKIKIDKIYYNTENKDGQPYKTKKGEPFAVVKIMSGDDCYSCCDFDGWTRSLQEGSEVELILEEKDGYLNFKRPRETDRLRLRVEKLEKAVATLWQAAGLETKVKQAEDDLPFF